jgi:hypothetical protein
MGRDILMKKALRYYHTLRHLKATQLYYQFYYRARKYIHRIFRHSNSLWLDRTAFPVRLVPCILKYVSFDNSSFSFLNLSQSFGEGYQNIKWEFGEYGKLWEYNLNYFDFLHQPGMTKETGIHLIESFIGGLRSESTGLEPYPISLRGINWIKFLSLYSIQNAEINGSLYAQYRILEKNLEYHLFGNHLLENAFSLLFGAFFFQEQQWFEKSRRLLDEQLNEQILDDGGHFELSPMYHQILLDRLLDGINLLQNNRCFSRQDELLEFLVEKALAMLNWLQAMTFSNGSVPFLNDAVDDIAPKTHHLFDYASRLELKIDTLQLLHLTDSGYRRRNSSAYECMVDIGAIGPGYIPGHAHADSLNFVLSVDGMPFIVDTGISTYEKNSRRDEERSTTAHNTVVVNGMNSSDVWGGFRVGQRAETVIIDDNEQVVSAEHDGYKKSGVIHRREWQFHEETIVITDSIKGEAACVEAYLHFDYKVNPVVSGNTIHTESADIVIAGADTIELRKYLQATGFNRTAESSCAVVRFKNTLTTTIVCKKGVNS